MREVLVAIVWVILVLSAAWSIYAALCVFGHIKPFKFNIKGGRK